MDEEPRERATDVGDVEFAGDLAKSIVNIATRPDAQTLLVCLRMRRIRFLGVPQRQRELHAAVHSKVFSLCLPLVLLFLLSTMQPHAQPMPQETFASITNMMVLGHVSFSSSTKFELSPEQQEQVNTLAVGIAEDLAHYFSLPKEATNNQQTAVFNANKRHSAAFSLHQLAQAGLFTDERIIPSLLTAIKNGDGFSLDALVYMTRRMGAAVMAPAPHYFMGGNPNRKEEIIHWWERWWERNRERHPVYDARLDERVRTEFMRVEKTIEGKVKPAYPELCYFHAEQDVPPVRYLNFLTQLHEHQYEPFNFTTGVPVVDRENMPWMEVACRFEDPEFQTPPEQRRVRHPPERLASLLTTVYSNRLEGTSIYVEVRVATPNADLVAGLKKALSVTR